ncbi:MAG: YggS family pyridoxal phosphate-dependent enzyme [Pseudomonadota bacterium]
MTHSDETDVWTTNEAASRLGDVRRRIIRSCQDAGRLDSAVTLVAVSKTFDADAIRPIIAAGQRVFGENRIQEALSKWPELRGETPDLELHLIGPLQSNKAKEAVQLFDVIETVDRDKIAGALAAEMAKQGRKPRLLVQVNTGEEPQKAGIAPKDAEDFVVRCREAHGLEIEGLMCIPPIEDQPSPHFALLKQLADELGLATVSMGMSADFEMAVELGATHVRVGSAIFGARNTR